MGTGGMGTEEIEKGIDEIGKGTDEKKKGRSGNGGNPSGLVMLNGETHKPRSELDLSHKPYSTSTLLLRNISGEM